MYLFPLFGNREQGHHISILYLHCPFKWQQWFDYSTSLPVRRQIDSWCAPRESELTHARATSVTLVPLVRPEAFTCSLFYSNAHYRHTPGNNEEEKKLLLSVCFLIPPTSAITRPFVEFLEEQRKASLRPEQCGTPRILCGINS